jgi:lipopolysaccharide heptosyltransferase I
MNLERVLIVKLSSIGDVVHALPVAAALKAAKPSIRITWAVERWTAPLVTGHPAVDRVVVLPPMMRWPRRPLLWWRDYRAAIGVLREETYDLALDLQGLAKSAIVSWLSRAPSRIARAGQREGAYLVSRGVPLPTTPGHAVDEYLHVARTVGAGTTPVEFHLRSSAATQSRVHDLLATLLVDPDAPMIVVNPSTAQRWKEWPGERWSAVIQRLAGFGTVVMLGTAAQQRAHAAIARAAGTGVVDLTGQTSLEDVIALIERADIHVAADTGTVHIAVAVGTPVVALYGPTSPGRVGPYRQHSAVVSGRDACGRLCPAVCLRQRRCLTSISVDEVVNRAAQVLARREADTARSGAHTGRDTT